MSVTILVRIILERGAAALGQLSKFVSVLSPWGHTVSMKDFWTLLKTTTPRARRMSMKMKL